MATFNTNTTPLKSRSTPFNPIGVVFGRVHAVNGNLLNITIPRLSGEAVYEAIEYTATSFDTAPVVGETVLVSFIEGNQDDMIVLGRVRSTMTVATASVGSTDWSTIANKPDPVITVSLTGQVTGTGNTTLTDLASGTISITTTVASDIALGTGTSGNYVATIAGTTNQVSVANSGIETAAVVLSLPQDIHTGATPTFGRLTLSQADGTPPLIITSKSMVTNLNAEYVGGQTLAGLDGRYVDVAGDTMTGTLNLRAGTAAAGSAPIKFAASSAKMATPEANAFEWDGTYLYITTPGGARKTIAYVDTIGTGTSATSDKWTLARTVTFGNVSGDITGSFTIDGSADVSNVVLTIAPNSVALGTDTTGNYIGAVTGTTNQITATATGTEPTTIALSLPQDIHTTATPTFGRLTLSQADGTSPLIVTSQTMVTNLNAEFIAGQNLTALDTRFVNVTGDTMTGTLTSSHTGVVAGTPADGTVFDFQTNNNALGAQPFTRQWADVARWRVPSFTEISSDGTTFTATSDVTWVYRPFAGDVTGANGSSSIDGTVVKAVRWTFSSGLQYSMFRWVALAIRYSAPAPAGVLLWQTSADGTTWTTRATGTLTNVNNRWAFMRANEPGMPGTEVQHRFTLTHTAGTIPLTSFQLLTDRPGDQGSGENRELPFAGISSLRTLIMQPMLGTAVAAIVRGFASQTADLQQWTNSSSTILASINASGQMSATGGMLSPNLRHTTDTGPSLTLSATSLTLANRTTASNVVYVVQGMAGQTGDLLQLQNSSAVVLANITAAGQIETTSGIRFYTSTARSAFSSLANTGGSLSFNYPFALTDRLTVTAGLASTVPATVKGATSQTANLQEWQTSAGTVVASMSAAGVLTSTVVSGAPLVVASTTVVNNLNAELIGGQNLTALDNRYINVGGDTLTGTLNLSAGTASAGSAPIKFAATSAKMTTPEAHALEWDGTYLYMTQPGGARKPLAYLDSIGTGTSATADKWTIGRTVTFSGGDVTGSFTIDGSADVNAIALTIAADSVALGTDTTGNYVSAVTGTANQITATATGTEPTTIVLSLPQNIHTTATPTFSRLTLSQVNGTAPLSVTSTTVVTNLNADLLDDQQGTYYTNASNIVSGTLAVAQLPAFSGDATTTAGTSALTLATVNANVGAFGGASSVPVISVNAKGLVTAASVAAVVAPAGTLSGTTLTSGVTASSLTSVGTLTSLTMGGKITAVVATAGGASLRLAPSLNINPTTPVTGDVWNNNGVLKFYDGAATKDLAFIDSVLTGSVAKWTTARTVTFAGGDVTGSFTIDGSANVSSVTLTIAAESVALGTDTTGNYVAAVTQSSANQVIVTGTAGEGASFALSLPQDIATTSAPTFGGLTLSGNTTIDGTGGSAGAPRSILMNLGANGHSRFQLEGAVGLQAGVGRRLQIYSYHGIEIFGGRGAIGAPGYQNYAGLGGTADTGLTIYSAAATNLPMVVKGFLNQSASLLEWQSSTGTKLSSIDAAGGFYGPTVGPVNQTGGYISLTNSLPVNVITNVAATTALVVKGATSQSANLQEWQTSTATSVASLGPSGTFTTALINLGTGSGTTRNIFGITYGPSVGSSSAYAEGSLTTNAGFGSPVLFPNEEGWYPYHSYVTPDVVETSNDAVTWTAQTATSYDGLFSYLPGNSSNVTNKYIRFTLNSPVYAFVSLAVARFQSGTLSKSVRMQVELLTSSTVTTKALLTNVATLTVSAAHSLSIGSQIEVTGVGVPFDGVFTVTATPSTTQLSYAVSSADVTSVASGGSLRGRGLLYGPTAGVVPFDGAILSMKFSSYSNWTTGTRITFEAETWVTGDSFQLASLMTYTGKPGNGRGFQNKFPFAWDSNKTLTVGSRYAAGQGLIVKGATSQSANLQEWQSSAGTILASISSAGVIIAPNGVFSNANAASSFGGSQINSTILSVHANAAGNTPLRVRGAASQTANLQEWQDSAGSVVSSITVAGDHASSGVVTGSVLRSNVAVGTAPIIVASTTKVQFLNADLLDGQDGTWYQDWTNVTNKPDPVVTVTLTGKTTGSSSVTLTDLGSGTVTVNTALVAALDDLSDVVIATPTDDRVLDYNAALSRWEVGKRISVSGASPASPVEGDIWFDSSTSVATSATQRVYIQQTQPVTTESTYMWIQTTASGDLTFWIQDGT